MLVKCAMVDVSPGVAITPIITMMTGLRSSMGLHSKAAGKHLLCTVLLALLPQRTSCMSAVGLDGCQYS